MNIQSYRSYPLIVSSDLESCILPNPSGTTNNANGTSPKESLPFWLQYSPSQLRMYIACLHDRSPTAFFHRRHESIDRQRTCLDTQGDGSDIPFESGWCGSPDLALKEDADLAVPCADQHGHGCQTSDCCRNAGMSKPLTAGIDVYALSTHT